MKKSLALLLILYCIHAQAQITITNEDLAVPEKNLLFAGFPNHIYVDGARPEQIHVSMVNGYIMNRGNNNYIARVIDGNKTAIIRATIWIGDRPKTTSKTFTVESLGDTTVYFVPEKDTVYSNNQRANRTRLEVSFSNINFKGNYEVAHFDLTVKDYQGIERISKKFISGPYFDTGITDILKTLRGGQLVFEQMVLKGNDSHYSRYQMPAIQLSAELLHFLNE